MQIIDWTKPIEHVVSNTKVRYLGEATKGQLDHEGHPVDEFRHMVISGKYCQLHFVDDNGRVKITGSSRTHQQIIRNVVTVAEKQPAAIAPNLSVTNNLDGAAAAIVEAVETMQHHSEAELAVLKKLTFQTIEAVNKNAQVMAQFASAFQEAVIAGQQAYLDAGLMLIDEMTKRPASQCRFEMCQAKQQVVATAALPAPNPKPSPPRTLHSLAEIGRAAGAAPIKGFDHLDSPEISDVIRSLAIMSGVTQIVIGQYEKGPAGGRGNGTLKYMHDVNGGTAFKVKAYGQDKTHEVFIYCERYARDSILTAIVACGYKTDRKEG